MIIWTSQNTKKIWILLLSLNFELPTPKPTSVANGSVGLKVGMKSVTNSV